MKKQIMTTALASMVAFSGVAVTSFEQPQVHAATVSQNNQAAVEAKANELIKTAKGLMGKATYSTAVYKKTAPYQFSCATFLNFIFEKHGVDLATYNENYMMQQGTAVSKANLQKGDLVFFDSNRRDREPADHVGMYIGNNQIIHMADAKQNIIVSDLNGKAYYRDNYIGARRVLPSLMSGSPATAGDKVVASSYSLMKSTQAASVTNAGFVQQAFKRNGIQLGGSLQEQMKKGTFIPKSQLKKGDIVFFNGTTGSSKPAMAAIYAGDHRIIMKTSSGVVSRVLFVDWYEQHYLTARRVLKSQ